VKFIGALNGVVTLIIVLVAIILAEEIVTRTYRRLAKVT
jgi:hypothetical protein